MTQLNSASKPLRAYPPLKLGLCTNEADERKLTAAGFDPVWRIGNQAEGLKPLLGYPRGRYTIIGVAEDLRIIGDSRKAIFKKVRELKAEDINFLDIRDDCSDDLVLVERALAAKSSEAGMRNHCTARRRGSKGGLAKKLAAEATRNAILARDIVMRLCSHPKLTKRDCAEILGPPFSLSTLIRNY